VQVVPCDGFGKKAEPNKALDQAGHANEGESCFASRARVSRLVSLVLAG
jgi:hypothetical protein